jgi:hypothetical protein
MPEDYTIRDPEEFLGQTDKGNGGGAFDPRFTLKPFDTIRLQTRPAYLVKGILPRTGLAVIWGPPKCGKSFFCFDLLMHVALGWEYRGHKVKQGAVVYLALEGGNGFHNRIEAWRQRHLAKHAGDVPFYLLDVPIDLISDQAKLLHAIRTQLGAVVPAAVVIDTLNRALVGNENEGEDMAKFIRASDAIRTAFDCVVVIVHHCGIAGSRPRGHTSLSGADDAQIAVARDKNGNIATTVEFMKDDEAAAPIGSRLERVELGLDDDGDPISSCVIVPAKIVKKERAMAGAVKLALDQLHEVLAETGEVPPANSHIPRGIRVCSAILWREHFYRAYPGKPDTQSKAFVRACLKLQELKKIGLWSDMAWLPDMPDMTGHFGQMSDSD